MEKKKFYGFIWHVDTDYLEASEGAGGSYCDGFMAESGNDELAAKAIIYAIVYRSTAMCKGGCEHTHVFSNTLTQKMIMGGMTSRERQVSVPDNKRELVLRVASALEPLIVLDDRTPEGLGNTIKEFPDDVVSFLNDPACLNDVTDEEVGKLKLGSNFTKTILPFFLKALKKKPATPHTC